MASYTVELTSPTDCDRFKGTSASVIKAKFDCQLDIKNSAYFGFTFGAISAISFILNMILESMATCKCAINITNEVKFLWNFF
jgi:hypothetical protein